MAMPSNVGYTTVTGTFIKTELDGNDAGVVPDGTPLEGLSVTFTPNLPRGTVLRNDTSTPPVVIVPEPIFALTDVDGVLYNPITGAKNVTLVASDDEDLDPHGWSYKVDIVGAGVNIKSFSFEAPAGVTLDLAVVTPVPASPGEATRWKEELQVLVNETTAASAVAVEARNASITARDAAVVARDGAESYYSLTQDVYGAAQDIADDIASMEGLTPAIVLTTADYAARKAAGTIVNGVLYLTKD